MRRVNTAIVYKKAAISNMSMMEMKCCRDRCSEATQRAVTVLLPSEAPTGCLCLHVRSQPQAGIARSSAAPQRSPSFDFGSSICGPYRLRSFILQIDSNADDWLKSTADVAW